MNFGQAIDRALQDDEATYRLGPGDHVGDLSYKAHVEAMKRDKTIKVITDGDVMLLTTTRQALKYPKTGII
ncbi:MAG: hypothetical protein V3W52_17280 [Syntrophobacteria bacterium]